MLGGVTAFVWYEARAKQRFVGGSVYGPALLVFVASVLIMADPTRHVLQDLQLIGASMYKPHCHAETFACLSIVRWFVIRHGVLYLRQLCPVLWRGALEFEYF